MLEFCERAYFFELERKTKLHTAIAFPITISLTSATIIGYALGKWPFSGYASLLALLPVYLAGIALAILVGNCSQFLIGREYKYIFRADEALVHLANLQKFSESYPTAPTAQSTFDDQLKRDLAMCAAENSKVNDERSENLYYANAACFFLVIFALITGTIVSLSNVIK